VESGGQTAAAEYRMDGDDVMVMTHTEVPPALEGQGIASTLVKTAVAYAREHELKIRPQCSYVRAWVTRHPEVEDLIAK
jgi:predicted GNAT family acetyltransferase